MSIRPTLRLTLACDNACIFCSQDGLEDAAGPDLDARIDALIAAGHEEVTLVGGEPLLADDVVAVVARLRERGLSKIGAQTNGALLGEDASAAGRLADAGLTDVHLSIHGARAEVHDYHTGHEGSFVRASRAMTAARKAGLTVVVTTVLTRSNQAVLSELVPMLKQGGAAAWQVAVPVAVGRAESGAANLLPRLAVALPYALHALDRATKAQLPAFISGAPLCLLGPFAARALPSAERSYGEACEQCASRPRCPGVDPLYLARFAGDELRPVGAPTTSPPPIAALFVGEGEHAPRTRKADGGASLPVVS